MKRKKILLILSAILLLALVLGGVPLLNRIVYGRSLAATILAMQFRKDVYTDDDAFQDFLAQKRAENAVPYLLPPDVTVPVERSLFEDMCVYTLRSDAPADTCVLYFTGGSFTDQPRSVHWQFLQRLVADTGAEIVLPIYPKLPDANAETVYPLLMRFCEDYLKSRSAQRVLFMGDSAGGGIVLSLAIQLRDKVASGPEKLILLSPWVDLVMQNELMAAYEKKDPALDRAMLTHLGRLWAGNLGVESPIVSPLYGEFAGLCPVELYYGRREILCPDLDNLCHVLDDAGVAHIDHIEEGMFHVWPLYVELGIPESRDAYETIVEAIAPWRSDVSQPQKVGALG